MKINGELHYLWRAVDHEGEVLEAFVTKRRDKKAALKFLKKIMKRYGKPHKIVTDRLKSYRAVMKIIGKEERRKLAGGRTIDAKTRTSHFNDENRQCSSLGG